jgi:formate/nitrite transporter FocA (FNT family)
LPALFLVIVEGLRAAQGAAGWTRGTRIAAPVDMADDAKGPQGPEKQAIEDHLSLRSPAIYEVIRRQGMEELRRPVASLWWSGVAGGLALSTSTFCQGFLYMHLPATVWRPVLTSFGYCIGFLIVILGRLQLFTENTLTVVLPLLKEPSRRRLMCGARLWIVVLLANMTGTLFAATVAVYGGAASDQMAAFLQVAADYADRSVTDVFLYSVPAGFFVAALVWIAPSAESGKALVVIALTYMIALGDLTHVVAGSTEVFLLSLTGSIGVPMVLSHIAVTLAGNVIGGTGLFAVIAYGQVRQEL